MHNKWDHINCPWGATTEEACRQIRSFRYKPAQGSLECAKHGPMIQKWIKYTR